MAIRERAPFTPRERYTKPEVVRSTVAQIKTAMQDEHLVGTARALAEDLKMHMFVYQADPVLIQEVLDDLLPSTEETSDGSKLG